MSDLILIDANGRCQSSQLKLSRQGDNHPPICAKLLTTNKDGRKDVISLSINRPVTIGRSLTACSYTIRESVVSSIHCKLYVIHSSEGGIIVSCQDLSTNGIKLNGMKISKASVILMDGDIIEIPGSQSFTCIHILKQRPEKNNIFDPTPSSQVSYKRMGDYTLTSHCLGSGSFATVHLAVDIVQHRQVACKVIKTRKRDEMKKICAEATILMSLDHPNINKFYSFEERDRTLQIFLQLCTGGDLFTYISSHTDSHLRLVEGEAKYIMFQLLKGLFYLHHKQISHRDLKPENILLFSPGPYPRILIADFGLARQKSYQETLTVCGTVQYLPPEGILALDNKKMGYHGMPADCWSAGVILFVMLSGYHPFDYDTTSWSRCDCPSVYYSETQSDSQYSKICHCSQASFHKDAIAKRRISNGKVEFSTAIWDDKKHAKHLVTHLLMYNPANRFTILQALHCAWIAEDLEELETAYQERIIKGA